MALSQPDPEEVKKNLLKKAATEAAQNQNPGQPPASERHKTLSHIPFLRHLVESKY